MIDYRHQTFLTLAEIKNYTKTAKQLHMTQPAVTQHIQFLEEKYKCKLFEYINKNLELTMQGEELQKLLLKIAADIKHFKRDLNNINEFQESLIFGATLSIGEYIMPNIIAKLLEQKSNLEILMEVNNTENLLKKLQLGDIDFAIVEGIFDKSKYQTHVFSLENFIPICAFISDLAKTKVTLNEVTKASLIIREKGSGTREILEDILKQYNYSLNSFNKIIEIGNMAAIKKLVANNTGITFLYEKVAQSELDKELLHKINIHDFNIKREFNFVFLKNSFYESKYIKYFKLMKDIYDNLS